jgi:hypothetical protein
MDFEEVFDKVKDLSKKGIKLASKEAKVVGKTVKESLQEKQYNKLNDFEIGKLQDIINLINSTIECLDKKDFEQAKIYLEVVLQDINDVQEMYIFVMNEADQLYQKTKDFRARVFLTKIKEYDLKRDDFTEVVKQSLEQIQKGEHIDKVEKYLVDLESDVSYELTLFNGFIEIRHGLLRNEIRIHKE